MIPCPKNFTLYRGSTFTSKTLRALESDKVTPVDLTGYTAHAKVRARVSGPVILDLNPTITDGPNGDITTQAITDELTALLPCGSYIWDLLLEDSSSVVTGPYVAGSFTIKTAVSRS